MLHRSWYCKILNTSAMLFIYLSPAGVVHAGFQLWRKSLDLMVGSIDPVGKRSKQNKRHSNQGGPDEGKMDRHGASRASGGDGADCPGGGPEHVLLCGFLSHEELPSLYS